MAEVTLFEVIGGEAGVRRLVDAFYERMHSEPAYAEIRALHPPDLSDSRDKLFWFFCGWMGGPNHFIERFGHPRLRARHLPFAIGLRERDQWMHCMTQVIEAGGAPAAVRRQLLESFAQTADWMRNRAE